MPDEDDVAPPDAVVPGTTRPSRSAKRIVVAVSVAAVVLIGLALWVLVLPYRVTVAGFDLDCDDVAGRAGVEVADRAAWEDILEEATEVRDPRAVRACDDAEDDRRTIAFVAGAAVAIAACAVSTVPSRRLTGDKLGPLR